MLSLAFSLWPNESLNVSCKVKQIQREGLRAPAMASQLGAAGGNCSSKDRSISQLQRGCCDPALHGDGQAGRQNRVGNPYPLPLPSEGRVPNPRGKVDFGPSRDTESPAEGGSVLLVLWSQAGTSYEGFVMGLAPRNAPLCHQMLQRWFPLHRYPSISLCLTFSWIYFSHWLYGLFILATTSLTVKMYTSQQCKVLISIKAF